jgi:hypothetical protein
VTQPADQQPTQEQKPRWRRLSDPPPTWNYILGWYFLAMPHLLLGVGGLVATLPHLLEPSEIGIAEALAPVLAVIWVVVISYGLTNVTRAWRHSRMVQRKRLERPAPEPSEHPWLRQHPPT